MKAMYGASKKVPVTAYDSSRITMTTFNEAEEWAKKNHDGLEVWIWKVVAIVKPVSAPTTVTELTD
jgi:hypothetical protein